MSKNDAHGLDDVGKSYCLQLFFFITRLSLQSLFHPFQRKTKPTALTVEHQNGRLRNRARYYFTLFQSHKRTKISRYIGTQCIDFQTYCCTASGCQQCCSHGSDAVECKVGWQPGSWEWTCEICIRSQQACCTWSGCSKCCGGLGKCWASITGGWGYCITRG